jgi:hypothetical protein
MSVQDLLNYQAIRGSGYDSSGFSANVSGNLFEKLAYMIANPSAQRRHVGARSWADEPGTDFWVMPLDGSMDGTTGGAGALNVYNWEVIAGLLSGLGAGTQDFLSLTGPGTYPEDAFDLDVAADYFFSPAVFGGTAHREAFQVIMGATPTKMKAEWYGRFEVAGNNEPTSGMGFAIRKTTTPLVAANDIYIYSNGTNFILNAAGSTDTGAAIDTDNHLWGITFDSSGNTIEWFIDDVSQGTVTLVQDIYPLKFAGYVVTANFLQVKAPVHIWYEV